MKKFSAIVFLPVNQFLFIISIDHYVSKNPNQFQLKYNLSDRFICIKILQEDTKSS